MTKIHSDAVSSSLTPLLSQIDEDESREYEYYGKGYNPPDSPGPSYAVDVEEEVGKPVVARDKMAGIDKSDVKVGKQYAALYAAYGDFAHRACGKEVDGVENRGKKVQAHTGTVGPISGRGGVSQKDVVHSANDEDGDESTKLPLHQWNGYRFATYEPY